MKLKDFFKTHGWCKGAYARTKAGLSCDPNNPDAVQFCVEGAFQRLARPVGQDEVDYNESISGLRKFVQRNSGGSIEEWNDDPRMTFREVLRILTYLDI